MLSILDTFKLRPKHEAESKTSLKNEENHIDIEFGDGNSSREELKYDNQSRRQSLF